MYDNTKNLLFLLAAAPLASGCVLTISDDVADDETSGDGDGDPTTGDGDGDASTGDGDGDASTGDGDGDPTTGDGDGDPSTGDGDGDPSTGDGDGDTDTDTCGEYAAKVTECFDESEGDTALQECLSYLAQSYQYGAECAAAFEDYIACVSALPCEEFAMLPACPNEYQAWMNACLVPPSIHTLGLRSK